MARFLKQIIWILPVVFTTLASGCGGQGSPDNGPPTDPPITSENVQDLSKEINANRGPMKPGG